MSVPPWGCCNKDHKLGDLTHHQHVPSHPWKLRVKTEGDGCASSRLQRRNHPGFFLPTQVASHPGCPWLQLYASSICAFIYLFSIAFPICVCVCTSISPFKRQHPSYWNRPHPNDTLTTWFDFKDHISKEGHCIGYFSVTVVEPKHLVKERISFISELREIREVRAGAQGRNLEADLWTEAMEEHYFLAFWPWLAQLPFLFSPGPPV